MLPFAANIRPDEQPKSLDQAIVEIVGVLIQDGRNGVVSSRWQTALMLANL